MGEAWEGDGGGDDEVKRPIVVGGCRGGRVGGEGLGIFGSLEAESCGASVRNFDGFSAYSKECLAQAGIDLSTEPATTSPS